MQIVNVSVTCGPVQAYNVERGFLKTLQAYTAPKATCRRTAAAAIPHLFEFISEIPALSAS